ncbi:DnaJ-domain-containing protein [Laetiporus sulphureus 93-53]|uniref:DnaJ-domain-containing protein n=1 Tax=Laetiporus sulphureus 93-53 TaxID=1314785 RepID=A0A165GF16_9APHY|nr:DnaJ-domain-containing protein [Laetiporus sulphureus 93-53]KZT10262.1 DnaJ-domain-containing protein [Laetiporus sulphureus 93-53]
MSGIATDIANIPGSPDDREFLYTVLNLPKTASEYEIRERYRQLSVVFHPDKQYDERTKETATKRFLEIQKAYQVLSDPASRRAYDLLGAEGLKALCDESFHNVPPDEFDSALTRTKRDIESKRLEDLVRTKGRVNAAFDASALFENREQYMDGGVVDFFDLLQERIANMGQTSFSVRHSVQKDINDKTTLILSGRGSSRGSLSNDDALPGFRSGIMGTLRHQYSPRLNFEATINLLRISDLDLKTTYRDDDNTVHCEIGLTRGLFQAMSQARSKGSVVIPPLAIAYSRRLFPDKPTEGSLMFSTSGGTPALSVAVSSAHLFDYTAEASVPPTLLGTTMRPPSMSGLLVGNSFWNVQANLSGLLSAIGVEWGIIWAEIGLRLRVALQFGLVGINWSFGGEWRKGETSIGSNIALGIQGVILRLDMAYLGQQFSFPITLSHDRDFSLALWTTVMPSTALVVTYFFVLRPRRRRQRIQFFREARRQLQEEKSDVLRETKETIHLLEDLAKRHMQAEASCNGLVIQYASYGPSEEDEATEGLRLDVTVPLQALVYKSQLYIPGRRSKAGLQGFYDPAPGVSKTLRIRYTFRDALHYAEIPDWMPVVLPLEEHLVD